MIGFIIAIVILVALFWIGAKNRQAREAADKAAGITARFTDVAMTATHLVVGGQRHPLAGLAARVEDAGQLNRRITATRIMTTGPFALAWRKRRDDRSVFLTVEGPGVAVVREIKVKNTPGAPAAARLFAAKVNAASGVLGPAEGATAVAPAQDLGGQLAELARLREADALTGEEFAAAKARLLGTPQPPAAQPEPEDRRW